MLQPREPWNIRPAKKRVSVTASLKTKVETKARDLIENVLKPKHVLPSPTARCLLRATCEISAHHLVIEHVP